MADAGLARTDRRGRPRHADGRNDDAVVGGDRDGRVDAVLVGSQVAELAGTVAAAVSPPAVGVNAPARRAHRVPPVGLEPTLCGF